MLRVLINTKKLLIDNQSTRLFFFNQFRGFKRQVVSSDFEIGYNEKNFKKKKKDPVPHLLKKMKKEENKKRVEDTKLDDSKD